MTAFIIDSYKWLQQDNTQIMIRLLVQISSQLPTPQPLPSFISTSSTSLGSDSADFRPTMSSVWINVLWLLSLLFSLTAALLGIIIKQWLREYLLWDSVLSPSREAVLLRHIRYAAWERWKVPAIISAIPAMLEFALVLFLCGSTILLWTLNVTVAIIITIFGGTFFILACVVNILPIFFHRCPYKSATGWTCLVGWKLARRWTSALFTRLRLASRHDRRSRPPARRQSSSWRQRDLQRRSQWGAPIPPNLHTELDRDGHLQLSEFVVLFQALAWVCTSTHDDRLLAKVRQCAANFPRTARKYACLVPGMHVVCQIFSLDIAKFFKIVRSNFHHQQYPEALYGSYTLVHRRVEDIWQGHVPELAVLHMVGDVLRNVVQSCIDELFPNPALLGAGHSFPQQAEMDSFIEALCLLIHIFPLQCPESQRYLVDSLIGFYDKLREALVANPWLALGDIRGPRYPGFTATIFQLLSRIGVVNIDEMGQIHGTSRHILQR